MEEEKFRNGKKNADDDEDEEKLRHIKREDDEDADAGDNIRTGSLDALETTESETKVEQHEKFREMSHRRERQKKKERVKDDIAHVQTQSPKTMEEEGLGDSMKKGFVKAVDTFFSIFGFGSPEPEKPKMPKSSKLKDEDELIK